jgi:hypothetical protein
MSDVLGVTAGKIGDPIRQLVLMEADNLFWLALAVHTL